MHELYRRNDPIDNAYVVRDDTLNIRFGDGAPLAYHAEKIIIGATEYFLRDFTPRNRQRLFSLAVRNKEKLKIVPFTLVDRMMSRFRFGFNTNIFSAYLLHTSNQYYLERSRHVPSEFWSYKLRAQQYAKAVDTFHEFGISHSMPELAAVAERAQSGDYYIDGVILSREVTLRAVSAPSKPITKFISRFKESSYICLEGTHAESMYILLRGKIAVTTKGKLAATISEPGEAFGEAALFLDGRRTASLIAEEDTDVYEIKRKNLPKFFTSHRNLFVDIAVTLAKRVHDNVEKISRIDAKIEELKAVQGGGKTVDEHLEAKSTAEVEKFILELGVLQKKLNHRALDRLVAESGLMGTLAIKD